MRVNPLFPFLGPMKEASPRQRAAFDRQALEARDRDMPADLVRRVNLNVPERLNGGLTPAAHGPHSVLLLQAWQGYQAGDVVGFNASIARQLIELGVAEEAPKPRRRTLREIRDALLGRG